MISEVELASDGDCQQKLMRPSPDLLQLEEAITAQELMNKHLLADLSVFW